MAYRPLAPGETIFDGTYVPFESYLRVGKIIRIDYVKMFADIVWLDGQGGRTNVYLTHALSGYRSGIEGVPEENSLVVCGWLKQNQTSGRPIILTYLSPGIVQSRRYSMVQHEKGSEEKYRLKDRTMYPGEIYIQSAQGSDIYIEDGIRMSNKYLNEIWMRDWDQALIQSSLQRYTQCEGMMQWQGKILRDIARERDDDPTPLVLPPVEEYIIRNGKKLFYITRELSSQNLIKGGIPWIEDRQEILECGEGRIFVSEFNGDKNIDRFEDMPYNVDEEDKGPMIVITKGTIVGNDPYSLKEENILNRNGYPYADRMAFYGFVLMPYIYETWDSVIKYLPEINIRDEKADSIDKERKRASCLRVNFPNCTMKSGQVFTEYREPTKIDFDKEGKLLLNVARSGDTDPLGKHRSIEANINGSIKLTIGRNFDQQHSIYINTQGSITEVVEGYDLDPGHIHYEAEGNNLAKNTLLLSGCENYEMHGGDKKKKIYGGNFYIETRKSPGPLSGEAITGPVGTEEGRVHVKAEDQIRIQSETETIYVKAAKNIVFEAGESISFSCGGKFIVDSFEQISMTSLTDNVVLYSAMDVGITALNKISVKASADIGLMADANILVDAAAMMGFNAGSDMLSNAGGTMGHKSSTQLDTAGVIHHNGPSASTPPTPPTPPIGTTSLPVELPEEPF